MDFDTWFQRLPEYRKKKIFHHEITDSYFRVQFPAYHNPAIHLTIIFERNEWDELKKSGFPFWYTEKNPSGKRYILKFKEGYLEIIFTMDKSNRLMGCSLNKLINTENWETERIHNKIELKKFFQCSEKEIDKAIEYLMDRAVTNSRNRLEFVTGVKNLNWIIFHH